MSANDRVGSDPERAEASAAEADRANALVEDAIRRLGVDPQQARVTGAAAGGSISYVLRRGSARIAVAVHPSQGERAGTLRVAAPVVRLPAAEHRAALFQHLLELNARELVGAAFGLLGDEVIVVSERPLRDLDASEVDAAIRGVGRLADTWDDTLAGRFEAKRSSDA